MFDQLIGIGVLWIVFYLYHFALLFFFFLFLGLARDGSADGDLLC